MPVSAIRVLIHFCRQTQQLLIWKLLHDKEGVIIKTTIDDGRTHVSLRRSFMMTSSNGNSFRVTSHLCGEFTDHRWIPFKGQWSGALMFSLICAWINGWVKNCEAGDLRRHCAHYDVTIIRSVDYMGFVSLWTAVALTLSRICSYVFHGMKTCFFASVS